MVRQGASAYRAAEITVPEDIQLAAARAPAEDNLVREITEVLQADAVQRRGTTGQESRSGQYPMDWLLISHADHPDSSRARSTSPAASTGCPAALLASHLGVLAGMHGFRPRIDSRLYELGVRKIPQLHPAQVICEPDDFDLRETVMRQEAGKSVAGSGRNLRSTPGRHLVPDVTGRFEKYRAPAFLLAGKAVKSYVAHAPARPGQLPWPERRRTGTRR